ncbi:MAG: DUF5717 family protein [Lachnospiraceae bacterium]|nr:DUF5717 family protein [Lachnospiraceae bacterium]
MTDLLQSALKLGRNKNIAREEYMVARGKKEAAAFAVTPSSINLSGLPGNTEITVHLVISRNGYMEIEAFCPDDFVSLSRRVITSDVFPGGSFDLPITIIENKLHGGRNFSCITFETASQQIRIPVTVDVPVRIMLDDYNPKQLFMELAEVYFNFRKGLMDSSDWAKQSLDLIGEVDGTDQRSMFLMLYKAQLYIEIESYVEAASLLEYMAEVIQKMPGSDLALNCYFLYVRAIYERDRRSSEEIKGRIRTLYDRQPSWQLLWILFQMDSSYEENPGLKLDDIFAEFGNGCVSPILYFEALEIFMQYPGYFSDASDFELQILNFARKLDYSSSALSARVTQVFLMLTEAELSEKNQRLAEKVLKYLYERYPTRDLLRVICRLLIVKDDRSEEAGAFYDVAMREYLDDIPGIFSYYIFTRPKGVYEPLPSRVMEYFSTGAESLLDYRRYFYANIVSNKEKRPEYYRAYEQKMLEYADQQMSQGIVDEDLAVIYKDIIASGKLTHNMRVRLFEIIATKEILCHNERMMNVMVFHDELNVYQDIPLNKGRAKVKVYSHNAEILFKDITGNIYANIDYEKKEFLNSGEYIDVCVKGVPISDYMLMSDTMPLLRGYKDPAEILNYMSNRMSTASFRKGYVKKLINDTVLYFSRNLRDRNVYDELLAFFKYDLDPETKGKLIEVMIERTLFRDAYEKIREEGFAHVAEESVARLSSALVELVSYREDALLLSMCEQSFLKTTFDPRIYKYMVLNYNDRPEVLEELYRAGRAYGEDYGNLPERILRRAIESGENSELIPQIFAKYYTEGSDADLKKAYMTYKAERYLYSGEEKDTDFFRYIENDLMQRESFSTAVLVAYLKYMSDKDISGKRRTRMIEVQLKSLVGRSIMLEEFKGYAKYFSLPAALSNAVIATCYGNAGRIVYDIISAEKTIHKEEQMAEIFEGCYAKYITLFYGERVEYSVNGEEPVSVSYEDLKILRDDSRYSELNNIIQMKETGNMLALNLAAKEYFVKDKLMERLF